MRPPRTARWLPTICCALAFVSGSCGPEPRRAVAGAEQLVVELDERPVLVGEVVERIDAPSYVYLRLTIVSDSAAPELAPREVERWVALAGPAPQLGERIRVRSLARRRSVWAPELDREFAELEYVAWIDG